MSNLYDGLEATKDHLTQQSFKQPTKASGKERLKFKSKTANKVAGAILNSECIPCGHRVNLILELEAKDIKIDWEKMRKQFLDGLKKILEDIMKLFDWSDKEQFMDLCSLIKWLNDFVCIPDLLRIGALLAAFLSKLSFDFNFGMISLILGLVGLILKPFLDAVVNTFMKYIDLIVAPIKCILESIQAMLRKLDFQLMFRQIANTEIGIKNVPGMRREGPRGEDVNVPYPTVNKYKSDGISPGIETVAVETHTGTRPSLTYNAYKSMRAADQEELNNAAKELESVHQQAASVNTTDAVALQRHKEQEEAAQKRYESAVKNMDSKTYMQKMGESVAGITNTINSIMALLEKFLRDAVEMIYALFTEITDELRKLEGEFIGIATSFGGLLMQKLQLLQLLAIVSTMVDAMKGKECNEDDVLSAMGTSTNSLAITTNSDGSKTITGSDEDLMDALENMANATPPNDQIYPPSPDIDPRTGRRRYRNRKVPQKEGMEDTQPYTSLTDPTSTIPEFGMSPSDMVNGSNKEQDPNFDGSSTSFTEPTSYTTNSPAVGKPGPSYGSTYDKLLKNVVPSGAIVLPENIKASSAFDNTPQKRSGKRLKSLLQSTGDPVLDADLARLADSIQAPTVVKINCKLKNSVADAERVNQWIQELS